MLIFGFGAGAPKDQGPALPIRCPNCSNEVHYHYAVQRSWFRLFFVPVIPYKTRHILLCPVCSRGVRLARERGADAAALVQATAAHGRNQLDDGAYREQVRAFLASIGSSTASAGSGPAPRPRPMAAQQTTPPSGAVPAPVPAAPDEAVSAGWYPDPFGRAEQRYWDGSRWTRGTIPPDVDD